MIRNYKILYNSPDQLLRCRLAIMLEYYGDALYYHQKEIFFDTFVFLFQGISESHIEKAFSLQCLNTMKTLLEDSDLLNRLKNFIKDLMPHICQLIENQNEIRVFEIVRSIISGYKENLQVNAEYIANSALKRIEIEAKKLFGSSKKNSMVISQCLYIIEEICSISELVKYAENAVNNISQYISMIHQINFEDEILSVLSKYMKNTKQPFKNIFFMHFNALYEKHGEISLEFFEFINYAILYSNSLILENPACLNSFVNIGIQAMISKSKENNYVLINNIKGALILQNLIQTFGENKLNPYIPTILKHVIDELKIINTCKNQENIELLKQQLINLIICLICNYMEITITILNTENILEETIRKICIQEGTKLNHQYDLKLNIMGMIALLSHIFTLPQVQCIGQKILSQLISLLYEIYKKETQKANDSNSGDDEKSSSGNEEKMNSNDENSLTESDPEEPQNIDLENVFFPTFFNNFRKDKENIGRI